MPDVDFDREFNSDPAYPLSRPPRQVDSGLCDASAASKAGEGRRFEDILRWAAAKRFVGKWHQGETFTGSSLENEPAYATPSTTSLRATPSSSLGQLPGDPYRYIIPTNPLGLRETGWQFNPQRDYISSRFRNV